MQEKTPLTKSKQWKLRSDIRSEQETQPVTVPKLVEDERQSCLNTNRFDETGSPVIMFDATKVFPDNAFWIPNFFEWEPILDCNNLGLAITTLGSEVGSTLSTKPVTGKDNQLWSFDSMKRLVNKETGLVVDGSAGPSMQEPTPLTESKQWRLRIDIRSTQETAVDTVPKLVEDSQENCLNTQDRFDPDGSTIILFPATGVSPG